MTKKNGVLVSFIGSRGSGKTTIANVVDNELRDLEYTCARQHVGLSRRPLWKGILTAISLWRFFNYEIMRYLGFYGRSRRWVPSLYRLYLPLAFMHDINLLKTERADVLIYDSNVFRGLIASLEKKELSEQEIQQFYKRHILSEVDQVTLAVIDTSPDEGVERWQERDGVILTPEEKQKEVKQRLKTQRATEVLIRTLQDLDAVHVVRLDGSRLPAENAARIVASITISD